MSSQKLRFVEASADVMSTSRRGRSLEAPSFECCPRGIAKKDLAIVGRCFLQRIERERDGGRHVV